MHTRQGLAIVWVGVVLALPSACEQLQPEGIGEAVQRGVCQAPLTGGSGGMGGCGGDGGAGGAGGTGGWPMTTTTGAGGAGGTGGWPMTTTTGAGGAGGVMMGCVPGSMCNDGNACTINDVCEQDGVTCVGTPKACDPPLPGSCVVPVAGTCNPATGLCATAPAPAGTSCNDSNLCTLGDTCNGAGSCVPGMMKDCTPGPCQVFISCTPTTGVCNFGPAPLGAQCNDNDPCTSADVCTATGCAGTSSCAPSGPCDVATCNAQAGCTHSVAADGTACANMDQCTAGVCVSGACTVVNQLDCDQPGDCQIGPGSCVVGQGCVYPPAPDNTPCGVNDLCATGACQAGACVQTPVACPPPQDPCSVAYCDAAVGCASAPQPGLACDDANPCTTGDACAADAQGAVACGGVPQLDGVPCALAGEAGVCIAGACFISVEAGTGGSGGDATSGAGGGPSGAGGGTGTGTGGAGVGPAPATSPQSGPIRLFGGGCAASGEGGDRRGAGLLGLVLLGLLAARRRATSGGS